MNFETDQSVLVFWFFSVSFFLSFLLSFFLSFFFGSDSRRPSLSGTDRD